MNKTEPAYIYVLKSTKNGKRYVGYTKGSPETRLRQHNSGSNKWTKENGSFELVYTERYEDSGEARRRERFLKSGVGRKILSETLKAQFPPKADPPQAEVRVSR